MSRNREIYTARTVEGLTYDALAERFKLSRERVRQIYFREYRSIHEPPRSPPKRNFPIKGLVDEIKKAEAYLEQTQVKALPLKIRVFEGSPEYLDRMMGELRKAMFAFYSAFDEARDQTSETYTIEFYDFGKSPYVVIDSMSFTGKKHEAAAKAEEIVKQKSGFISFNLILNGKHELCRSSKK